MYTAITKPTRPELLAPAGGMDAFHAAIDAGANAVYLGLDGCFNARLRAKNFTVRDLCSLVPYAHSRSVKIYVTLNTLIKQAEIKPALDVLYQLDQIGVDAVIIADIGLMKLASAHFPKLRIHASTQASVHNSYGAGFLKTLGAKRVVLARELSLDEIRETTKRSPIETEVFIHGALCYGISGLCLASSFIGGASGNRGKCTQVCRRRFKCGGRGGDGCDGYFFSPYDLQTVSVIQKLIDAGVTSFKIEGRMKGAEYVSTVVKAYRDIIDNPNDVDIVDRAMEILRFDFGREKTAYFIDGRREGDVPIDPLRPAGIGVLVGTVVERGEAGFIISISKNIKSKSLYGDGGEPPVTPPPKTDNAKTHILKPIRGTGGNNYYKTSTSTTELQLNNGDRLRIQPDNGFEGVSCKVAKCVVSDDKMTITTTTPVGCNVGDHVFLIGRADVPRKHPAVDVSIKNFPNGKFCPRNGFSIRESGLSVLGGALRGYPPSSYKDFQTSTKTSTPKPTLWFKADSVDWLPLLNASPCQRLIFDADIADIENLLDNNETIKTWRSRISIALPPFIEEARLKVWRDIVEKCLPAGLRSFTVSNIGHFPLVKGAKDLTADALLWCLNGFTQRELLSRGIHRFVYSYEDEYLNIRDSANSAGVVTVYSKPPMFISRMPPAVSCGMTVGDPHGNKFFVVPKNGLFYTLPQTPMCLFAKREKLARCGIENFLIDVSFHEPSRETAAELIAGFKDGKKIEGGAIFNFKAGLH